jgi:hypothetical protein
VANAEVLWVSGALIGCRFTTSLSKSQLSAALLKSQPLGRSRTTNLEARLRRASQRLAGVSHEVDAIEQELIRLGENATAASEALVDAIAEAPPAEDEQDGRFPLFVRGWTILLSSIFLWGLLLWGAGLL